MTSFETWCDFLNWAEGTSLSLDPKDKGNFSDGVLVGTKFGISAAAHPGLDIANLTLEQANRIRKTEYWNKVRGDELPGGVAFVLAEAIYGGGPAIKQLQQIVGTTQDGVFGPNTMAALQTALAKPDGIEGFIWEYSTQRLLYEASLAVWPTYKLGWTRRLFNGLAHATELTILAQPVAAATPATSDPLADTLAQNLAATKALLDRVTAAGKALAG